MRFELIIFALIMFISPHFLAFIVNNKPSLEEKNTVIYTKPHSNVSILYNGNEYISVFENYFDSDFIKDLKNNIYVEIKEKLSKKHLYHLYIHKNKNGILEMKCKKNQDSCFDTSYHFSINNKNIEFFKKLS